MNPLLQRLHPYPFERWRILTQDIRPPQALRPINLGIGEPRHATPKLVEDALCGNLQALSGYPATAGEPALRQACAAWLQRRYGITLDPLTQVLPVNGSREALFAFAQTVVDPTQPGATVVCPNPFYQIYEGAALLAGAQTAFANSDPARNFAADWSTIDDATWARTQLLYVCSPGNPTGAVMPLSEWERLFELSDRHGFVIASDECYSEIWFGDTPPLGGLQAAARLGRSDFRRLLAFTSLSKRSNVPGMRSGFVAGDAALIKPFLLYRTYHGSAMSGIVQAASIAAWNDEAHVEANRALYRTKFDQVNAAAGERARHAAARRRLLPVGRHRPAVRRRRHRLGPGPARSIQCDRPARQPARAHGTRPQPGQRPHPHGPRRRRRGLPRSGPPHRLLHRKPPMSQDLQTIIDLAWEGRASLSPTAADPKIVQAVEHVIADLNAGRTRVAERQGVGQWTVNQWVKKAVLLSFRLKDNHVMRAGDLSFFDKVETKFGHVSDDAMKATGIRVVPPAVARRGSFIARNVVLMPSYVNIGAYVDEGTMVDTWATVGSCAQIGKGVHLSGGVGIGGVLEPLQANPTIIEDNCFIGARSEVVEGVIVEENSVLGMGVYLGQSTPIFNRETGEVTYGRVPSGSVVVSGNLPKTAANGQPYSLYAAVIVKRVDAQTRSKTSINDLLRP